MQLGSVYLDEQDPQAKLGHGAYGDVYKAKRIQDNAEEEVAVKKILKTDAKTEELKAIMSLNDDNIVKILELFYQDDHCYLIMELCDSSLSNLLEEEGSLTMDNFDTVLQGLASGYKSLCSVNIIHRDLKPANILLNFTRPVGSRKVIKQIKITDFGSSRLTDSKLNTKLIGTPLYMAPEIGASVLAKGQYDSKVDMWSIGVMLYECIAGKLPFDEKALCKLFLLAANRNYQGHPGPEELPQVANDRHRFLINGLLQLDPDRRLTPTQLYCLAVHKPRMKHAKSKKDSDPANLVPDCNCWLADAAGSSGTLHNASKFILSYLTVLGALAGFSAA